MKKFDDFVFDLNLYETELIEFKDLLERSTLSEKNDILPFFRARRQLSSQIATLDTNFINPTKIAFEYDLLGDFCVDLAIGQIVQDEYRYCFIEFEDAQKDSIFKIKKGKYKPEFAARYEHGYSQVIDWFYKLDGLSPNDLEERFGRNKITYDGVLIVGRDSFLATDKSMKDRFVWRNKMVVTNSLHIRCLTFDELYRTLNQKLQLLRLLVQHR